MSSLSDNTTRRALGMQTSAGYIRERTNTDGYESRIPKGGAEVAASVERMERALWLAHLRESMHRADHGVIT